MKLLRLRFSAAFALSLLVSLFALAPFAVAQTYSLAPVARQQFLDVNGVPLAGGLLYTYAAGTSTPLATYQNSVGSANTNPIILDSGGFASIWLGTSAYKFVAQNSSGVQQWAVDNIVGTGAALVTLSGANGASLINYTATGTGTVARTVASKLGDFLNFKDLGGVCDGATDDTAALQAAVTRLTTGQTLILPPSTTGCLISSPGVAIANKLNVSILGFGVAKLFSTAAVPNWSFFQVTGSTTNLSIEGIVFQGSATTSPLFLLTQNAVQIQASPPSGTVTGNGFRFARNQVIGTNNGIQNTGDTYNYGEVLGNTFSGLVDPTKGSGYAAILTTGKYWHIHDNVFLNDPFQDVYLSGDTAPYGGAMYSTVENNYSYNCGPAGAVAACFTSGAYTSSVTSTGLIFQGNHIFSPQAAAISADGHMQGTLIANNEVTGAVGNLLTSGEGIIQMTGATTLGGGSIGALITGNIIRNSTGNLPCIDISDGNYAQVTNNVCQNNPSSSPGIFLTTIEGGVISTGNLISGNLISGGGAISIQGAGVGASTYTTVENNSVDGTIFNFDPAVTAHNIIAGNGGPGNPNFAVVTPVSIGANTAAKSAIDIFGGLAVGGFAGVTAAPSNGAIVSGFSGFGAGAGAPTHELVVAGTGGVNGLLEVDSPLGTQSNWGVSASQTIANALQFVPSTAVGGHVFTTPAAGVTPAGAFVSGGSTGVTATVVCGGSLHLTGITIVGGLVVATPGCS